MIINCHCHIFSLECVPRAYRKRLFLDLKNPVHKLVYRLLMRFLPPDSNASHFLSFAGMSIRDIAEKLVREMDEAGIETCTPLMMDMKWFPIGNDGSPIPDGDIMPYEQQIEETEAAAQAINARYGRRRMIPFVAADARRPDVVEIVKQALERGMCGGVKIYPVMGFKPNDPPLHEIYRYCVANDVPVTTHCERGGIPGLGQSDYDRADPTCWRCVLNEPELATLKLNLAHNDRTGIPGNWQAEIAAMIRQYRNVYTDLSYDCEMWYMPRRYFRNVQSMLRDPKIGERVLYGTDWYMGRYLWTESSYLEWFTNHARTIPWCRVRFSDEETRRLTEDNPKRFLGL